MRSFFGTVFAVGLKLCALSLSVDAINVVSNNIIEENFIDDDEIIDQETGRFGPFWGVQKRVKKGRFSENDHLVFRYGLDQNLAKKGQKWGSRLSPPSVFRIRPKNP